MQCLNKNLNSVRSLASLMNRWFENQYDIIASVLLTSNKIHNFPRRVVMTQKNHLQYHKITVIVRWVFFHDKSVRGKKRSFLLFFGQKEIVIQDPKQPYICIITFFIGPKRLEFCSEQSFGHRLVHSLVVLFIPSFLGVNLTLLLTF